MLLSPILQPAHPLNNLYKLCSQLEHLNSLSEHMPTSWKTDKTKSAQITLRLFVLSPITISNEKYLDIWQKNKTNKLKLKAEQVLSSFTLEW